MNIKFTKKVQYKIAFTLAEVLITLGIIGVVAAITIPGLMTKINDKITSNRMSVIEKRFIQSLNMLNNQENGLNVSYDSTEDFVKALSKYLKMTTICSKDNLTDCMPYDKIYYESNGKLDSVDVSDLTTAKKLQIKTDGFVDTAGFIMADGTPFILTYNQKCNELDTEYTLAEPDRPMKSITPCIAAIYDINGATSPNKFGTKVVEGNEVASNDIKSINGASIGNSCVVEVGDICITTNIQSIDDTTGNLASQCPEYKEEYGFNECYSSGLDRWFAAFKTCKDKKMRLPNTSELTEIAKKICGSYNPTASNGCRWPSTTFLTSLGYEGNLNNSFSLPSNDQTNALWYASSAKSAFISASKTHNGVYHYFCVKD